MPHELDTLPDGPGVHRASVLCDVPALQAFAFLADGFQLGTWALGAWDTQPVGDGVVRGRSLFDDQPGWVRPVGDAARLRIDYHVGGAPEALTPRILATVEPLPADSANSVDSNGADRCRVTPHAARDPGMDDARWLRLVRCHEVEVLLIQGRLAIAASAAARAEADRTQSDPPRSSRP
ncbi:hypothetical protein BH10PSE18_BH10PSE18_44690 [soil metagenome]